MTISGGPQLHPVANIHEAVPVMAGPNDPPGAVPTGPSGPDPTGGERGTPGSGGQRPTQPPLLRGKKGDSPRRSSLMPWFGKLSQLDFDISFYEKLLARNGDSVDVLRVLGELASRKGLHERALELDLRLVERVPGDSLARYNLACSQALAGQADAAIESLGTAFRLGYDDVAHMVVDPDLASLRGRPEFRALLRRV